MSGWPNYTGRALDCTRCNSKAPSAACSCLLQCGAERCTGEAVPVIDKPTRTNKPRGT